MSDQVGFQAQPDSEVVGLHMEEKERGRERKKRDTHRGKADRRGGVKI